MTYDPMQNLEDFHNRFDRDGENRHDRPVSFFDVRKRMELIREEFQEVMQELANYEYTLRYPDEGYNPISNLAKELADLLYVVYGTAEELRIPLQEVFEEVH